MVKAPPALVRSDSDTDGDEDWEMPLRGKWMLDGCCSLEDVAECLRERLRHIERLQREGWELREEITDDYGFLQKLG